MSRNNFRNLQHSLEIGGMIQDEHMGFAGNAQQS